MFKVDCMGRKAIGIISWKNPQAGRHCSNDLINEFLRNEAP